MSHRCKHIVSLFRQIFLACHNPVFVVVLMMYNQINIHSLISVNSFGIKKRYQNMSRESQCAPSHESHWCFFQATFVIIIYKMNYYYHYMFYYLTSDWEDSWLIM